MALVPERLDPQDFHRGGLLRLCWLVVAQRATAIARSMTSRSLIISKPCWSALTLAGVWFWILWSHIPDGLGLADFILLPEPQDSHEGGLLRHFQGLLQLLSIE